MSKIYIQGTFGAYSHLAALEIDPNAEVIPCKTFDECFLKTLSENNSRMVIPESNRITGNIGIEYLIFKYRLNIYQEHFQKIEHNLLGHPDANLKDVKDVFSHTQGLSQCSNFIKKNKFIEHVRADTAGSAKELAANDDNSIAAIASELSAKIYKLEILKKNIEDEADNLTRFLIMGKNIEQPEYQAKKKYITSCIFRLKSTPSALYKCLGGFATNQINLTKLESFSVKNTFDQTNFYLDLEGHIEEKKVQKAMEELGFHTESLDILGVYEASKFRQK